MFSLLLAHLVDSLSSYMKLIGVCVQGSGEGGGLVKVIAKSHHRLEGI